MKRITTYLSQEAIESVLLPGILLLLGFYLNPTDPFFQAESFPWVWFGPLLISLRYGSRYALISLAVVIATLFFSLDILHLEISSFPIYLLGGILTTLLCSHYKDAWILQENRLDQQNKYMQERLEVLTREQGVLRLSHDRLEQSLITTPVTLRDALHQLNQFLKETQGLLTKETADRFLQLLAHYTSLETAALYLKVNNELSLEPIATLGPQTSLMKEDPLVERSLLSQKTCCVSVNTLGAHVKTDYIVVAPLLCSDGRLLGLLTVSDMPFLMLNNDTLKILSLLLAYFADDIWAAKQASTLQHHYPDCPSVFGAELFKVAQIWQALQIDSALLCYYFWPTPTQEALIQELLSDHRTLDCVWLIEKPHGKMLLLLLPLAGPHIVKGLIERFHLKLEPLTAQAPAPLMSVRQWQVSSHPDITQLLHTIVNHDASP